MARAVEVADEVSEAVAHDLRLWLERIREKIAYIEAGIVAFRRIRARDCPGDGNSDKPFRGITIELLHSFSTLPEACPH